MRQLGTSQPAPGPEQCLPPLWPEQGAGAARGIGLGVRSPLDKLSTSSHRAGTGVFTANVPARNKPDP